jgi:hypothetical protein
MSAIIQPLTGHRFPADEVLAAVTTHEVLIPDRQEVRAYLEARSDLGSLVPLLVAGTREEFGPEAQLVMSIYHDPEIVDHYLQLCVRLPEYGPGFLERMLRIWVPFEDVFAEVATGWFQVTTDYRLADRVMPVRSAP